MIPELDACLPARRTSTQLADYLPFHPGNQPHPTAHDLLEGKNLSALSQGRYLPEQLSQQ
jgi:hypothetical protein